MDSEHNLNTYQIAELHKDIKELREELREHKRDFNTFKEQDQKKENNRLVAGIVFLGGLILSLGSYIWMKMVG